MRWHVRWPLWIVLVLVAVAGFLLFVVRPYWPGWVARYQSWQRSRPVHAQLARSVPLSYPAGVPLETLLLTVSRATRSRELPSGIPIFIDPAGLQKAGATETSRTVINAQVVPLRDALRSALRQHRLDYWVDDGRLLITHQDSVP